MRFALLLLFLVLLSGCSGGEEAKFVGAWKVQGVQNALVNLNLEENGRFSCIHRSRMDSAQSTVLANLNGQYKVVAKKLTLTFETANFDIQGGDPSTLATRQKATDSTIPEFLKTLNDLFSGEVTWSGDNGFSLTGSSGTLIFERAELK